MNLLSAACVIFCAVIICNGAEPPAKNEGLTDSKQEEQEHGPLMKALLAPAEQKNGTVHTRHKRWKGKKGGGYGGGNCCSPCTTCGGGGGGGGGGSWSKSSSSSSSGSWGGGYGKKK